MGPILLDNITDELSRTIRGGVISKVYQSDAKLLILKIFIRGREYRLLLSAKPTEPRMHLTEKRYPNPDRPLRFCAFLRAHITNALIEDVQSVEGERIARLTLKRRNEMGEDENLTLIIELTGKSANIILINSKSSVMDALRYFDPENSPRAVMPGVILGELTGKAAAKETIIEKSCETWNESADLYYSESFERNELIQLASVLRRVVRKVEKRLTRKVKNLEADILKAEKNIMNSGRAELLLANFKELKRGMEVVEVEDYNESPPKLVRIELDARLAPNENIDRLYKIAKKGKRTIELTAGRVSKVKEELKYLETLYFSIEDAQSKESRDKRGALECVRDELTSAGYIKERPKKRTFTKKAEKKSDPIERISLDGDTVILIGKSGLGNDLLVKKHSARDDLWFHALGTPGAHVLLKGNTKDEAAITEAAKYAAIRSKAGKSKKVEVIVAKAGDVKKPKGAKPGMVTLSKYKTVLVETKL